MRPDELKEIAWRFTERYYPDHIRRFDRIWKMFEDAPADSIESSGGEGTGAGLRISGGVEEDTKEAITGIAVFAVAYKSVRDNMSVSGEEVREKISVVSLGANLSDSLREKVEDILREMLPSIESPTQYEKITAIDTEARKIDKDKSYVVYVPRDSGFGVQEFKVSEEELHNQFLSKKEEFDIIIYKQNVEIKDKTGCHKPIELYSNILILLILFLKYKDEHLSFLDLYHFAWKGGAEYIENANDPSIIIDDLKTGVSSLRKLLKPVKNFSIPNAKRKSNAYTCKGHFQFCLILTAKLNYLYTLLGD